MTRNESVQHTPKIRKWVHDLKERRGMNKATVALANKNARMAWAVMMKGEDFKWAA